jgi:dihydrofolate synthase/folylpolyglutamate synthase
MGLDHTQFYIGLIAQEKAGIIKPNVPVVIGEYTDETKVSLAKSKITNNNLFCF